jgi:hypothetical protein
LSYQLLAVSFLERFSEGMPISQEKATGYGFQASGKSPVTRRLMSSLGVTLSADCFIWG